MALALSAHTPRVQLSVYDVRASWRSELGLDTPGRYLAIGWNTCNNYYITIIRGSTGPITVAEAGCKGATSMEWLTCIE